MSQFQFIFRLFNYTDMKVQIACFYGIIFSMVCTFSERFMGISGGLFVLLFVILITDYITGLKASKAEGKKFCSKRGLQWVFKIGSYMIFLAISFFIREEMMKNHLEYLEIPFTLIHFYILLHIFWWELTSIDENFERIGYSFRVLKLANSLFRMFRNIFRRKLEESAK